mmetsp:Transcript_26454/g.25599  ORF Transcript_26454/g.25599 Transcript_26454/m.25599 type:complete len:201 (+) Transcript_26454:686-1288(+)
MIKMTSLTLYQTLHKQKLRMMKGKITGKKMQKHLGFRQAISPTVDREATIEEEEEEEVEEEVTRAEATKIMKRAEEEDKTIIMEDIPTIKRNTPNNTSTKMMDSISSILDMMMDLKRHSMEEKEGKDKRIMDITKTMAKGKLKTTRNITMTSNNSTNKKEEDTLKITSSLQIHMMQLRERIIMISLKTIETSLCMVQIEK